MTIYNITNLIFILIFLNILKIDKFFQAPNILFSFFPIIPYYYHALFLIYTVFSQRYYLLVRRNGY